MIFNLLSEQYFENINKIKPKSLDFRRINWNEGIANFNLIKVLKHVRHDVPITFGYWDPSFWSELGFKNAIIKITQAEYEKPLYIKCESFNCYTTIDKRLKYLWSNQVNSDDEESINKKLIKFSLNDYFSFNKFRLLTVKEEQKYSLWFPKIKE